MPYEPAEPAPPVYSVIIPFRNAAATIAETLDSLAAQTYPHWEALLVDDGSEDDGPALVQRSADADPRLKVVVSSDTLNPRGAAATRNIGLAAARGDYVAFLDADDLWLPSKLEKQNVAFSNGADIVFSSYDRIDRSGQILGRVLAKPLIGWQDALAGNPIGCLTAAYRRNRFPEARMPEIGIHEDYAFWLAMLQDNAATAVGLPDVLARYRVHPGSASANKLKAARAVWRILATQNLSLPDRCINFMTYATRSIRARI